jgi:phosphomannomutase
MGADGGFLTGSDMERNGAILSALLTRDAILPILGVLFAASDSGSTL